ncbi:hypothetical protein BGZ60DRAFT_531080 [Tricladium varicosporioides]|nr:hypothetical protein BGZ60DRAFT_531080 [Hymenoscyphus varicosporioides]
METTFITIHNLTSDANLLFASESIIDILGYYPEEVIGKSCFDYFHPEEVPFARTIHSKGVQLDKAAVLNYARIRNRDGLWIGCECVFTIVYEVLVACTSIYRGDAKNERRLAQGKAIRRIFASSPRDPRYHMLEHLSSKFRAPPQPSLLEPRAALILNRFTRTLTVMYATSAVSSILGVTPEQFQEKSFYECIQENCLPDAIRCIESAKSNDSIAYLRFWYRDPRRDEDLEAEMHEASQSSDSEDGGVELHDHMDVDVDDIREISESRAAIGSPNGVTLAGPSGIPQILNNNSRTSSGESTDLEHDSAGTIFDHPQPSRSSTSSVAPASGANRRRSRQASQPRPEPFELEAVVSCTSDGLVVVLRRARPLIPQLEAGVFLAPWGVNAIRPHVHQPNPRYPFQHGPEAPLVLPGGPPLDEFMTSIQDVAVFAWSLAGINGNVASYGRGVPQGEAQPPGGLPIWDPYAQPTPGYLPPENQAIQRLARQRERTNEPASGNKVPFQHPREESLQRHGFGADNTVPGYQARINSCDPVYQHDAHLPDHPYHSPPQQPRQDITPYSEVGRINGTNEWLPATPNMNNDPPHAPGSGPTEGSRGNRYLWY